MIGSFITRGLAMIFGYAYPAYECYKTIEKNKPEIEQLRFWCQYWILVAVLTVCERIGDAFVSWVPMYCEAKLAFFIYLWYPKTKGTSYVYESFFRPYVEKHEMDIDRSILELRTRAGDIAVLSWQRAASYGQTRIYEILQYVAAQSTSIPRTPQPQHGATTRPAPANRQAGPPVASATQSLEEPPSPTSSTSSSQHQNEVSEEVGLAKVPKVTSSAPVLRTNAASDTTNQPAPEEAEPITQIVAAPPSSVKKENGNTPPEETVMTETIRVTRGRLRKTRTR